MDDSKTLSEVLMLLDGIGSPESDSSSVASFVESHSSHDDTFSTCSTIVQPQLKSPTVYKDRRRKGGPVRYTTSLQRRKKAELRSLREEAQRLNAQLEKLQLSRLSRIGVGPAMTDPQSGHSSVWCSLAMIESEGRERAERTNRALKAIMANQLQVHASICKLLRRSNVLEGMDFVFQPQPTSGSPLFQVDFSDAILSDQSSSLGRLRLEVDRVFPALEGSLSITCSSQAKHHETRGNCVDTSSIAPMTCTVQQAGNLLWHHITTERNTDAHKAFSFVRTRNPNSLERNCMASLPDGNDALLHLDGLQFEDHHWTTISPSPTDSQNASVVRSCYQLQVKQVDTRSVQPGDLARVENVVLNSIGKKLRNVLQLQQNVLLDHVDPVVVVQAAI
ncbi:hypothetical protein PHYSODRAFT_318611 [Phytophthora sojae]|uniref:Uncharacterized protein n=1 Tax=Phytophthora sojae (strain P6497) TaxID=1094619 RepID=G5A5H2_PHYSP|nr:hypothetical protein PHYSODRAFT_318611 [Phytophthora sojae]EGZ08577.1 hypothetical protein PHYSODRAFT_318611 [Phytophthora sojae]|eukprot:XP_009535210.1 hypothetical protein PHYSODRAFT_318611 [Phytophthora sojae]